MTAGPVKYQVEMLTMRNALLKVLKVVHMLAWLPLNPILGRDFPLRFFRRKRVE